MITKNFLNAVSCAHSPNGGKAYLTRIDGNSDTVTCSGGAALGEFLDGGLYFKKMTYNGELSSTSRGAFIFLGSGTTKPTKNDVTLESHIPYSDTGLKVIDSTYSYKLSADTFINFVVTVKNTTDSPIDISEIALIFRPNGGNYINYPYNYMIARNVFDTITMEPGEVRSFTMTISV